MTLYRCLKSAGFQVALVNAKVERNHVNCGLVLLAANLGAMPLRLMDIDTGHIVCLFAPPPELQNQPTATWLHSPIDDIELEIIHHEKQSLPNH